MKEALKLALEALEEIHVGNMTPMAEINWNKAITAIKEALEQPEQEPVAWEQFYPDIGKPQLKQEPVACKHQQQCLNGLQCLCTTPPKRRDEP